MKKSSVWIILSLYSGARSRRQWYTCVRLIMIPSLAHLDCNYYPTHTYIIKHLFHALIDKDAWLYLLRCHLIIASNGILYYWYLNWGAKNPECYRWSSWSGYVKYIYIPLCHRSRQVLSFVSGFDLLCPILQLNQWSGILTVSSCSIYKSKRSFPPIHVTLIKMPHPKPVYCYNCGSSKHSIIVSIIHCLWYHVFVCM